MRQKGFAPILILVIILVVTGVAYLGYRYLIYGGDFPSVQESQSPTPKAIVDATGWGSYKGSDYSLMYPPTFTISDAEENGAKGITLLMHGETQKNSGRTQTELFDGVIVRVLLFADMGQQSLLDYASGEYQTAKSSLDPNSDDYFTDLTKTKIAGNETYMYDVHGYSDAKVYYLNVGGNVLKIIVIYAGSDTDVPGYLTLANEILSTLKLTQ